MTQNLSFTLPSNYKIPETLKSIEPSLLCHVLDCMDFIIKKLSINDIETLAELKSNHQKDIEKATSLYSKRLEDQRKELTEEYIKLIDSNTTQFQKEKKLQEQHFELNLKKIETEKQQLMNDYEIKLNQERKRLRQECNEDLQNCAKKIKNESNERISSLEKELEFSIKSLNSLTEMSNNEKKIMQDVYERNLTDKEKTMHSLSTRLDDIFTMFQSLKSPVSKGQFGEKYMQAFLQKHFPSAEIKDTTHIAHSGDCLLTMNGITIMIEMKNKNTITKDDIKKFEYDIDLHKNECHGAIFLSTTHGIPNKGEFLFELYGTIPVMYISQFMDSPVLLNSSVRILLDFIPIMHRFHNENKHEIEQETIMQTLSSVVSTISVLCETLKQNCKTLGVIAQQALEQKKKNEEKIQTCLHEITFLTEKYKLKVKNTPKYFPSQEELFHMVYEERKRTSGKYIYKNILQTTIQTHSLKDISCNQLLRILPKSKFEEMCADLKIDRS